MSHDFAVVAIAQFVAANLWRYLFWRLAPRPHASAQPQNAPHIGYVYPAGGRQGDTFQVTVGGQYLEQRRQRVYLRQRRSGQSRRDASNRSRRKQVNDLREKLQELQKKPKDAETVKEIAEIRTKLNDVQNRRANPALAEKVTLQITIAPDAEPGQRELRLATPNGLSNPLVFHVGQLPEFRKKESKNSGESAQAARDREPADSREAPHPSRR